jgi:hypothetical protein
MIQRMMKNNGKNLQLLHLLLKKLSCKDHQKLNLVKMEFQNQQEPKKIWGYRNRCKILRQF